MSARNLDYDARAAPGKLDAQRAAVRLGALAHAREAPAAAARPARADRIGETLAVVLYGEAHGLRALAQGDVHCAAAAVLGGVDQRFLGDAKQGELRFPAQ